MRRITKGAVYRHFKGNYYEVMEIAFDATNGSNVGEKMVVYKSLADGNIYVRDLKEFSSQVNKRKYPDVKQRYRFEKVNVNKMLKRILGDENE